MARCLYVTAYDFGGAPKSGLTPTTPTAYRDGVSETGPTWTELGTSGPYRSSAVTLAAGEELALLVDLGETAASRYQPMYLYGDDWSLAAAVAGVAAATATAVWAAGTRTLTAGLLTAADVWNRLTSALTTSGSIGKLLVDNVDAPVSSASAPTVEEIEAHLAAEHGSGPWGGAAGDGAQAVTLQVRNAETDGGLSGARVDVFDDGGALRASATTNTAGEVELLLDAGAYTARVTLGGFTFGEAEIVVSSPDTVAPTHVDGTALPLPEADEVVGLSRTLSLAPGDQPNEDGVSGLVAGDDVTLTRSFVNVPSGRTIAKVRGTWKRPADDLAGDESAVVQLEVTGTATDDGQVTNDGSGGTGAATLVLTAAQHLAIAAAGAVDYDLQVTFDNDTVRTPELGVWEPKAGRTSSAP